MNKWSDIAPHSPKVHRFSTEKERRKLHKAMLERHVRTVDLGTFGIVGGDVEGPVVEAAIDEPLYDFTCQLRRPWPTLYIEGKTDEYNSEHICLELVTNVKVKKDQEKSRLIPTRTDDYAGALGFVTEVELGFREHDYGLMLAPNLPAPHVTTFAKAHKEKRSWLVIDTQVARMVAKENREKYPIVVAYNEDTDIHGQPQYWITVSSLVPIADLTESNGVRGILARLPIPPDLLREPK